MEFFLGQHLWITSLNRALVFLGIAISDEQVRNCGVLKSQSNMANNCRTRLRNCMSESQALKKDLGKNPCTLAPRTFTRKDFIPTLVVSCEWLDFKFGWINPGVRGKYWWCGWSKWKSDTLALPPRTTCHTEAKLNSRQVLPTCSTCKGPPILYSELQESPQAGRRYASVLQGVGNFSCFTPNPWHQFCVCTVHPHVVRGATISSKAAWSTLLPTLPQCLQ